MKAITGAPIMRMQALAVVLFGTLIQASAPAQAATVTEWTVDNVKMNPGRTMRILNADQFCGVSDAALQAARP